MHFNFSKVLELWKSFNLPPLCAFSVFARKSIEMNQHKTRNRRHFNFSKVFELGESLSRKKTTPDCSGMASLAWFSKGYLFFNASKAHLEGGSHYSGILTCAGDVLNREVVKGHHQVARFG